VGKGRAKAWDQIGYDDLSDFGSGVEEAGGENCGENVEKNVEENVEEF